MISLIKICSSMPLYQEYAKFNRMEEQNPGEQVFSVTSACSTLVKFSMHAQHLYYSYISNPSVAITMSSGWSRIVSTKALIEHKKLRILPFCVNTHCSLCRSNFLLSTTKYSRQHNSQWQREFET